MSSAANRPRRRPLADLPTNSDGVEESKGETHNKPSVEMMARKGRRHGSWHSGVVARSTTATEDSDTGDVADQGNDTVDAAAAAISKPDQADRNRRGDDDEVTRHDDPGPNPSTKTLDQTPGPITSRKRREPAMISSAPRAAQILSTLGFMVLVTSLAGVEYLCVYQNQCGTTPPVSHSLNFVLQVSVAPVFDK